MENKNTTDETFNTVIEPHNHRAIIGFDKNGIPKVLVPVSKPLAVASGISILTY